MTASATLNLARGCLYQHHSIVPRSKSPAFSNPKPFLCDFILGNGKLTVNNATSPKAASNPRRRFSCTSNLADYAQTTSAVYGFLLLSGGFFAFTRTGSKGSLLGGVSGAAAMATRISLLCMNYMREQYAFFNE